MTSTIRGNDGFDSAQYVDLLTNYAGRNKIINGCFRVWQRGISQTSTGIDSDDRWSNAHLGTTKTHTRQSFTLGQTDVPGNPQFYSRTVVSSVAGAANYCIKAQKIEGVSTFAGESAVLSFWAKADSAKNIATEFSQNFGTGGSPSASITGLNVVTVPLTTSWQRYTVPVSLPSITGKVLGTAGDNIQVAFWFDAGSSFDGRTNTLGQQSGTFELANIQLEAGVQATVFEAIHLHDVEAKCLRYYETGTIYAKASDVTATRAFIMSGATFNVKKRGTPVMTYTSVSTPTSNSFSGYSTAVVYTISAVPTVSLYSIFGFVQFTVSLAVNTDTVNAKWEANAEL